MLQEAGKGTEMAAIERITPANGKPYFNGVHPLGDDTSPAVYKREE